MDITFTVFAPAALRGKPFACDMGSVTVRNVPAGEEALGVAREFAARLFARKHRMSWHTLDLRVA